MTTPDGFIFDLYGPVEGLRHDLTLLRNSGCETILVGSLTSADRQFYIYRDQAYMLCPWMMRPFIGELNKDQEVFNDKMSTNRVSVEYNYKNLKKLWIPRLSAQS